MNILTTAPRTWLELSRGAFIHNIEQLVRLSPDTPIALVIKANGYGHGLAQMVELARDISTISTLCTGTIAEAMHVRQLGWSKRILAMTPLHEPLDDVIAHGLEITVYDIEQLRWVAHQAHTLGVMVPVHLKIDTGMNRLGIYPEQLPEIVEILRANPPLTLVGVMTHLSDTSTADTTYTHQQLETFSAIVTAVRAAFPDAPITVHALASGSLDEVGKNAVALIPSESRERFVSRDVRAKTDWSKDSIIRVGSLAYGNTKTPALVHRLHTKTPTFSCAQILTWKTRCMQIKHVPAGSYIGYNRSFQAPHDMVIGVLPIGYADGLPRALSNTGSVLLAEHYCPIVGVVSMSLTTIDLTHVPEHHWFDDVIITGPYPRISLADIAQQAGTLVNAIVTNIPAHIERRITS